MTPSPRASGTGTAPGATPADPAIVIGADEDERRLVRGLLLLQHRRIAFEAPTLEAVPRPPADAAARLLVFAAPRQGERWSEELRQTLADRPGLSTLVLLPLDDPSTRASAVRAGARTVLGRPYTSREFLDAVERTAPDPGPPAPSRRRPRGDARLRPG